MMMMLADIQTDLTDLTDPIQKPKNPRRKEIIAGYDGLCVCVCGNT